MRYSISNFRNFFGIFLEFFSILFRDFSDFQYINKNGLELEIGN